MIDLVFPLGKGRCLEFVAAGPETNLQYLIKYAIRQVIGDSPGLGIANIGPYAYRVTIFGPLYGDLLSAAPAHHTLHAEGDCIPGDESRCQEPYSDDELVHWLRGKIAEVKRPV